MIKRYCDRCGQQIDEGVHAWYVLELHGTDGEFRHKELCEECYAYLCEKDEVPMADCKTEPQRDCFLCKWLGEVDVCGRCRNRNLFAEADTEPKPKDEPQTCDTCKYGEDKHRYAHICNECGVGINNYEPKDEPQTERSE